MGGGRFAEFGEFRFDRVTGRLWRGDVERPLRAKAVALLRHLADHPGRLVTRAELLRAVWPGVAVSGGVVRVGISEIRDALGDDAAAPRFLETVGRRGYRFLGGSAAPMAPEPAFTGRAADLARLHRLLARCRDWRREVLFVAGEPGIGKTTLVERFADEVRAGRMGRVALGQCVELHGASEPYLPVFDFLGRLCADDETGDVVRALERWAPSWLLQMPGVDAAASARLAGRAATPNRERMLRELSEALDALGRDTPLVVVLEDLHWSDASTIDLLRYVAERATRARLLVVGTYRPVDLIVHRHPLHEAMQHLVGRGRAAQTTLELLGRDDVTAYLAARFAGGLDPRVAELVFDRTEGNPLFLVSVVDHLLDRAILIHEAGTWRLDTTREDPVPRTLRELVGRQLATFEELERTTLEAASVMGVEFDAVTVGAAVGRPAAEIDRICGILADDGRLVQATGTRWIGGDLGGTYAFVHSLHQAVLYQRLPPGERARLHRTIAARLEAEHVDDPGAIASVLASHYERGGEWAQAVAWHVRAAEGAKSRLAEREVVAHCAAVLDLLDRIAPTEERRRIEMTCSLDVGASLLAVDGYCAPGVEPYLVRARDIAVEIGDPLREILARGGLYTQSAMRGDHRRALGLAGDLLGMADRFPLPLFTMIGHTTLGCVRYNLGELGVARAHFTRARDVWQPDFPRLQVDQWVLTLGVGALVLQQQGDAAAESWHEEAVAYAASLNDPINVAHAFHLAAQFHAIGDDREATATWAERAIAIAAEHGARAHEAGGKVLRGWAVRDLALQRAGIAALAALGHGVTEPLFRLTIALTLLDGPPPQVDEALAELALAFQVVAARGEVRHLPELHRVRAACARYQGRTADAERELRSAMDVARKQDAHFFLRRARTDLVALLRESGRASEARAISVGA